MSAWSAVRRGASWLSPTTRCRKLMSETFRGRYRPAGASPRADQGCASSCRPPSQHIPLHVVVTLADVRREFGDSNRVVGVRILVEIAPNEQAASHPAAPAVVDTVSRACRERPTERFVDLVYIVNVSQITLLLFGFLGTSCPHNIITRVFIFANYGRNSGGEYRISHA